ncbi:MAG TPA: hypothetical protein DC054_17995 [Blastocatellia bacterium]|nr:hypothetical protein [Blastocatellia bacterium]
MAANLENAIQEKVESLPPEKRHQVLSVVEEMPSEKEVGREVLPVRPLWEIAEEISAQVPLEEWEKLPTDGADQHDHYLYGSPSVSTS